MGPRDKPEDDNWEAVHAKEKGGTGYRSRLSLGQWVREVAFAAPGSRVFPRIKCPGFARDDNQLQQLSSRPREAT